MYRFKEITILDRNFRFFCFFCLCKNNLPVLVLNCAAVQKISSRIHLATFIYGEMCRTVICLSADWFISLREELSECVSEAHTQDTGQTRALALCCA